MRAYAAIVLSAALLVLAACSRQEGGETGPSFQVLPVLRQDLVVAVSASGALEPLRSVEVKSKASGEIVGMPVELGDQVRRGALLVRVDPRDVRNQLEQAEAALEVAETRLGIARRQKERSEELYREGSISEQDHEQALLSEATAHSEQVSARVALELARERVADTEIRAPLDGTIIVKAVEEGQIISSATSQVTGGTTLLVMADLDTLQVRTMVDETDIGKIREGLEAEIRVDAYPRELFRGQVVKVEPQAVTVQNVTTFPVLVRLVNDRGLLLPGMNVDVEIRTDMRSNVLTLPAEALRTQRDYLIAAGALGLTAEEAAALFEAASDSIPEPGGRAGVAFLVEGGKPRPVPVGMGIANWDLAEILWGLAEGDSVAATLSSSLLQQQETWRSRMQSMSNMGGFRRSGEEQQSGGARGAQSGGPGAVPGGGRPQGGGAQQSGQQQGGGSGSGQRQGGGQQGGGQRGGQGGNPGGGR